MFGNYPTLISMFTRKILNKYKVFFEAKKWGQFNIIFYLNNIAHKIFLFS